MPLIRRRFYNRENHIPRTRDLRMDIYTLPSTSFATRKAFYRIISGLNSRRRLYGTSILLIIFPTIFVN